jgi:hypothetical protein
MQRLEVSCAVRHIDMTLVGYGLMMLAVSWNVYCHMVELFWNKLCAVWKEVIVAQFYTLSRNLPGRAQEKYEAFQSELLVS